MRMTWPRLLLILALAFGALHYFIAREILHGPGVLVTQEPLQTDVSVAETQMLNGYRITPLAKFNIRARVLATEDYYFGREADLSPLDLVLGWGRMSDEAVLKEISISQGGRFYFWHTNTFPIPREEIQSHSANMHMIPADASVKKDLNLIRAGHIVQIYGYLVRAESADGWRWKSSLTREDSGSGACELVLVQSVQIL